MKLMGTVFRRAVYSVFVLVLAFALSWHALLSFCVQRVADWKWGYNLAFRELRIEDGSIVLHEAQLVRGSDLAISAPRAVICWSLNQPLSLRLFRPHLLLPEGIPAQIFTSRGGGAGRMAITVENGTYEIGGSAPLSGGFSFQDKNLFLEGGGGVLSLQSFGSDAEKRFECSFESWPLAPFAHLLESLDIYPIAGALSGFVHLSMDKTIGRLSLDNAGWISNPWQTAGGAGRLEWEGEADLGLAALKAREFDLKKLCRFKIHVQDFFAVRKSSRIESMEGILFFNEGVGLRWELDGKGVSWHGKSFFRQDGSEWLQSRLQVKEAAALLGMEKVEEERLWTLALDRAGADFFQWICDFGPEIDWPCELKGGEIRANLSCKEKEGRISEWKAEQVVGKDLALSAADWDFFCSRIAATLGCKENERSEFDGHVVLEAGTLNMGQRAVSDLQANLTIRKGEISESIASAICNGLKSRASLSGSLQEILAEIRINGPWTDIGRLAGFEICKPVEDLVEGTVFLKGDWNACVATFCLPFSNGERVFGSFSIDRNTLFLASIEAKGFDLARLEPFWGGVSEGKADLAMRYADQKWSGHGSVEDLYFKQEGQRLWISKLQGTAACEEGRWSLSSEKIEGEAALFGEAIQFSGTLNLDDDLLTVLIEDADVAGIDVAGECLFSLEPGIPFAFEALRLQGDLAGVAELAGLDLRGRIKSGNKGFSLNGSLFSDPHSWNWAMSGNLSELCQGPLQDVEAAVSLDSKVGLLSCCNLKGALLVGEAKFPFHGFAEYQESVWRFDLRLEDRFRDVARLAGSAKREGSRVSFEFDEAKSHLLGTIFQVQDCKTSRDRLETLKLNALVSSGSLRSWKTSLESIDKRFGAFLEAPLEGGCAIELDLRANALSLIRLEGENLAWNGAAIPFHLALLQAQEKWKIEVLQLGDLKGEASLARDEDGWRIDAGSLSYRDGALAAAVSGVFGPALQCEMSLESVHVDLQKTGFAETPLIEGEVKGSGTLSLEWRDDLCCEADLDLSLSPLKIGDLRMENTGPLQMHLSKRQGLLVRGLDLKVRKPESENTWLYGRIGLMQYDFGQSRWFLHHSHLRLPIDSFSLFLQKLGSAHPIARALASLDPKNDLECFTEVSFSDDFSSISCSMKEGFIPFWGAVRHLQNVDLHYSGNQASIDFLALHQGHSFKVAAVVDIERLSGLLTLEDEGMELENGARALELQWELHPEKGLLVHSIEGSCGGIEASFHEEVQSVGASLIGTAKLDFGYLAELFSPRIGRVFHELKMGKGYELKGRFFYGSDSSPVFKGLLSGKNCELCGWQIRSLLSQVEIQASLVRLFELKGSDAAGILKIDQLTMSQSENEPWKIDMPRFKLLEFRPSLLHRVGREIGSVGPLVVRELVMKEFKGELEESLTYTAQGSLSFINSFKREHTVFDLPADVLGRIFGLDLELLIPVKGSLSFELKEGKFWLDDLKDAYSEGKRSKFFLVKEGTSPTIDLDGNVSILVKMKQYVLFKFTENFLLSIDGTLESPSYSLQKKSRIQKLLGL